MALSCRTFGLVHLLTDYAFGAAIRIVYGNPDGGESPALRPLLARSRFCQRKKLKKMKIFFENVAMTKPIFSTHPCNAIHPPLRAPARQNINLERPMRPGTFILAFYCGKST